jgi:hypothetical protein
MDGCGYLTKHSSAEGAGPHTGNDFRDGTAISQI